MEKIKRHIENDIEESIGTDSEKKPVTITEDSEYCIIEIGDKKRYIPKWKFIPVGGEQVRFEELVRAMALFPNDGPLSALEKLRTEESKKK